jgi:hypothetical protein
MRPGDRPGQQIQLINKRAAVRQRLTADIGIVVWRRLVDLLVKWSWGPTTRDYVGNRSRKLRHGKSRRAWKLVSQKQVGRKQKTPREIITLRSTKTQDNS